MEIQPESIWKINRVLDSREITPSELKLFNEKVKGRSFQVLELKDKKYMPPFVTIKFWFCKSDELGMFRLRDYTNKRENVRDFGIVKDGKVYNVEIQETSPLKM